MHHVNPQVHSCLRSSEAGKAMAQALLFTTLHHCSTEYDASARATTLCAILCDALILRAELCKQTLSQRPTYRGRCHLHMGETP